MGVQGFTPFLQKTAPHIIHKLPNRLRDLAGKKLVLDGTLITQRLHFAPSPHPFRHVLGWYNLARELNDNKISAVCIFDGSLRTKAKAVELGKREASRRLHASRGTLESVRIKRLQKLQSVMASVRALDEKGKSAIAEMVSRLCANDDVGTVGTIEGLNRVGETLRVLSGAVSPSFEESLVEPEQKEEQKQEQKQVVIPTKPWTREEGPVEEQEAAITPEAEPDVVEPSPVQEQPQDSRITGYRFPVLEVPTSVVPSTEDIKLVILNSYRDFQSSISKITSLPLPERKPKAPALMTFEPTEEADIQEEDLVLSKTQCELTLEEGKVWDELTLATSIVEKPFPVPEVPPTLPPLEVPPPTTDLPPSVITSLEPPSIPETPPAATLPPTVPGVLETPSPTPEVEAEAEAEAPPDAALPNTISTSLEPPSPPPETSSPPPETETETPLVSELPTTIPTSLEPPSPAEPTSPPPDAPLAPVVEIEASPAIDFPTTIPGSLEQPSSPLETPSPPPETPSLTPETGIETLPADGVLTTITAPLDQLSPPPSTPPVAALPIQTPPPSEVEEPEPEPATFTFDHLVLSAVEDRLDTLTSRSEIVADSYQRRTTVPTKATYREAREILEAMGIPCYVVQGEHEGEGVASSLVLQGMADYVVSEDTDVLVYGAPIIRNITSHGNPLVMIHGNDVREALELSNDACIDFAILVGTDFSQRIRNLGPMRALKLIKEYESIENILNGQTKYQPAVPYAQYMAQVNSARAIFNSPPPIPDQLRSAVMSTGTESVDQEKVAVVMERCGLGKALVAGLLWDYEAALAGNYFSDNPSMIVS